MLCIVKVKWMGGKYGKKWTWWQVRKVKGFDKVLRIAGSEKWYQTWPPTAKARVKAPAAWKWFELRRRGVGEQEGQTCRGWISELEVMPLGVWRRTMATIKKLMKQQELMEVVRMRVEGCKWPYPRAESLTLLIDMIEEKRRNIWYAVNGRHRKNGTYECFSDRVMVWRTIKIVRIIDKE